MKEWNAPAGGLLLALLSLVFTGCQSHEATAPLGSGYEEVNHVQHSFLPDPKPPRTSLQYRDPDGKITQVWPSLYSFNEVVKDDLAVFVAEKAFLTDGEPALRPRLFAVKSPAPPLDITDEVLWRWSQANHRDLTKTLNRYNVAVPAGKDGGLQVHLEFWPGDYLTDEQWPDSSDIQFTWNQISEMMKSVQKRGTAQKDIRWHTPYIGEQF